MRRMGRELDHAAVIVDQEVNRTVHITHTLSEEARHQVDIATETGRSTEVLEKGIQKVAEAMSQVVGTTQDVSSIVLQMQASVEEIALNSETLMKSVEKTVSSTNEMSTTAEQINSSTGILRESSQESVSFLTELDAALQETMRNATVLNETSLKVTQDAEGGFSSVAAVEEEIMRSRKASGQSLEALDRLQQSMEKIGKIVDVIEEVTEQTNLLALNASIIAAGAGEYGKSFAVVATQIRELSARTAGHAKEIRRVIKALIQGGEEMTEAISKTQTVGGEQRRPFQEGRRILEDDPRIGVHPGGAEQEDIPCYGRDRARGADCVREREQDLPDDRRYNACYGRTGQNDEAPPPGIGEGEGGRDAAKERHAGTGQGRESHLGIDGKDNSRQPEQLGRRDRAGGGNVASLFELTGTAGRLTEDRFGLQGAGNCRDGPAAERFSSQ